ncbi:class I poly(R)-hydroxyalkanoic acid synthase [Duganella sp. BJB488]|uniref:class I poly(R)-hydroxyalkanoic acid synthase n=1 Tax=unclassified Duganella TaxID=2636909 RepID=UPI000E3476AE|nr:MULTISPECIES: class I poly(R)-hydroxyalkanoic acid synthase [unclassified Duganella]NVD74476.1 class I poly(R)-hydroxyalkanoic acid synthase [Duganella sp. BJB1802]RFP21709.1 class I poly(R)-hydroxyalkanoic acid synthase [Duganella sp. BJB489]RFP23502.1 class I poly(R)-hydroxyalkanoic acid synthase [Duganella sp. BJB488]RFP38669.1 class I poly(R)-hydroxyalkanoic acid synthase [Duganella sp. BJB480]
MNLPDPQAIANAWMSQMSDPGQWQSWFNVAPTTDANPLAAMMQDVGASVKPEAMEQLKNQYLQDFGVLWQEFLAGKTPEVADRRFTSSAWQGNPMSSFNAASYLLNAKFLNAMVDTVDASTQQKQKIRFAVQQIIDAMSPANFLATNPEAQQKLIETKGESLTKGLANMLADMNKGHISLSDESAFEVGRNLATTEGTVVYENPLFQLIQYKPVTPTVHQRPLLMVPPCINKFYILDLQPENSLVRYAVEQGNSVFLISWSNPDQSLAGTTWDDYVDQGVIEAIHVVQDISGQDQMNMLGFCVGGTLVSTALAVLAARGEKPASSLTLLTTFLDFSDTGVLDVFVDEAQVSMREQQLKAGGLMPGRDLASTFSSLRPNDLVWNYVQSNYLKGNEPPPFDLLYWNSDSTNLPGPMFCWYLRNTYLENKLKTGKLTVAGQKVDLGSIDAPAFIYGSREDHIVPWMSAFGSMNILNPGKVKANRFVLGASGHIAGVINSPVKNKRSYWTNDKPLGRAAAKPQDGEAWMAGATENPGSWWPEWAKFLAEHGGKDVKPKAKPGNARYKAIEPAPGRYVKVRAD